MKKKFGIIVAGFGGQGVLFVGQLLAYAGMLEGKQVAWVPSYGPEMRGGTAYCAVTIADSEISSPLVEYPDALIAFNGPSVIKFEPIIAEGGLLLTNSSVIKQAPKRSSIHVYSIEANSFANKLGNSKVSNLIVLGALVKLSNVVAISSILQALKDVLPKHHQNLLKLNKDALEMGFQNINVSY
ncbi:2-oxoacid:acceptor oxidoreductase family protein [Metallumcola ferriviriculae]|uniref:2-oxoacid:acceptor oxidoreductase family protein n=1 Tax=Metallumcola ferriviriculae TaxID=3039180 RepID=A0AAU0UKF6_9FIRM|nr:2-oxoacid:acceptor oxidoreductase family protein [Desulfitibacteraceae bacterium MK1]